MLDRIEAETAATCGRTAAATLGLPLTGGRTAGFPTFAGIAAAAGTAFAGTTAFTGTGVPRGADAPTMTF
jgi:hypothetical protein